VAPEGVNAQCAVPSNVLDRFASALETLPFFADQYLNVDHTLSREEYASSKPFRAMHVRVRAQIVADGLSEPLDWEAAQLSDGEMEPVEWHSAMLDIAATATATATTATATGTTTAAIGNVQAPSPSLLPPPLVLDCRNSYESDVGMFQGATPLGTTFFRESWDALDEILKVIGSFLSTDLYISSIDTQSLRNFHGVCPASHSTLSVWLNLTPPPPLAPPRTKDTPKNTPIMTYCTGGIRCIKTNAYIEQVRRSMGVLDVYMHMLQPQPTWLLHIRL
jgi:hypothetical protein